MDARRFLVVVRRTDKKILRTCGAGVLAAAALCRALAKIRTCGSQDAKIRFDLHYKSNHEQSQCFPSKQTTTRFVPL